MELEIDQSIRSSHKLVIIMWAYSYLHSSSIHQKKVLAQFNSVIINHSRIKQGKSVRTLSNLTRAVIQAEPF